MKFQIYLQDFSPLIFLQMTFGMIGRQYLYSNKDKHNLSAVLGV
jgi:hypothetical protein